MEKYKTYYLLGAFFVLLLPQLIIWGFAIISMDPLIGLPISFAVFIPCFIIGTYFLRKAKKLIKLKRKQETAIE